MPVARGIISRWKRPKTYNDWMQEVQWDVYAGDYKRASRTLHWLMCNYVPKEPEDESQEGK